MPNNDIRARLATEWLRHQHTGCGFCRCGHRPDHGLSPLEAQAVHVAEVLLNVTTGLDWAAEMTDRG